MIAVLIFFSVLSVAVLISGVVVLIRIRRKHKEAQLDYLHRLEYYKRRGIGISYDRKPKTY